MKKWKNQRIEPCSNCGLNNDVGISWSGRWGLFCRACSMGYVSRYFILALWTWNYKWRKMRKQLAKQKRKQELLKLSGKDK